MFMSMKLPNLPTVWYCDDRSNNISLYWIIIGSDIRERKGDIQKLSMMNKLVKNVEKGVRIVNLPHLLVQNWISRHVLDLYNSVKHFLYFLLLTK